MTVYVFGHRNPDTDAICSAVAYADLLQKTVYPLAVAASCGPANARTEFALRTAGLPASRIMMDVRPEIRDVCHREIVTAYEDEVFFEVYQRLSQHKLRAIPLVSRQGDLVGILSLLDLLELVFRGEDTDPLQSRRVPSSLAKICAAVGGHYQHQVDTERREEVIVMVGAMSSGGFTERLPRYPAHQLLVVSGDRPTVHVPAIEQGVRGLVVTGGYELSPGQLQLAAANRVTVIISPHDTATTLLRIKAARSIEPAIQRDFHTLSGHQLVADARDNLQSSGQLIFPVVDDEGKLIGVVSKSDLVRSPKPRLVLVDQTNWPRRSPARRRPRSWRCSTTTDWVDPSDRSSRSDS